jgi:N-acetylneuraminic acid mutarotase
MFSTHSRRWCSLLASLLMVFMDLMPLSAASVTNKFSVSVKTDCLSCAIAEQFPALHQQLQGQVPWTVNTQRFGKRRVKGFTAAIANNQAPVGLKPVEQQAWMAMAERGQMQLLMPQRYNGSTFVQQGDVQVEVKPLGAQSARAERQGKTLVHKNAYPSTDSLQVMKSGRSEEFLYLHNKTAPTVFDYQVHLGKGVNLHAEGGSIAFVDSQGRGVRIERPWLVDSNGQRSESAVHWQVLEGGKRLRLVVEPHGLRFPLVIDPTWTTTDSMITDRQQHTATLLPNGKVLVTGGTNSQFGGGNPLNLAEVYDPVARTWSTTSSMSTPRYAHTATLLPNGKVLVAGGAGATNAYLSSAEVYDPSTGTWSATNSMSTARGAHTATLLTNGKVLVAGGPGTSSAELYDPQTSAWSTTSSMSTPRYTHTSTLLTNGKVLVAGGAATSSAELYDPQTSTWIIISSTSTARFYQTATLLTNGKVLVTGGVGLNNVYLSSAEVYDPQTDTWSTSASMSTVRAFHTATLLTNGKVLVAGGFNGGSGNNLGYLRSAELYDPQTGTWSTTSFMSTARGSHIAIFLNNGRVIVAGGAATSSAELYRSAR